MKKTMRLAVMLIAMVAIQHIAESQKAVSPTTPTLETVFAKMEKANKDYPYLQGNVEKSIYTDFVTKLSFDKSGKIWISNAGNSTHQVKVEFDKPQKGNMESHQWIVRRLLPEDKER